MKYKSKYSPGKLVTENQYIIELICEANARQTNRELPIQFWKLPQWEQFYKSQLRRCRQLLLKYRASSIIKAIKDKRCQKTYSLYGGWLEKVIKEYDDNYKEITPTISDEISNEPVNNFVRPEFKKSLMDKLDE